MHRIEQDVWVVIAAFNEEPVIGLPGTTQPGTSTPAGRGGQGK